MSCFFCDSNFHLSQNCDIHISDESRKEVARLKKCCEHCLFKLNEEQFSEMLLKGRCHKCIKQRKRKIKEYFGKCITCFSKEHDTAFCPTRATEQQFFIPNIDQILLPRFLQLFDDKIEKYSMAILSPDTFKLIPLEQLEFSVLSSRVVFKRCGCYKYSWIQNSQLSERKNIVLTGAVHFADDESANMGNLNNHILLENVIFKAKEVVLKNSKISFKEFFQLISFRTKVLTCQDVTFTTSTPTDTVALKKVFQPVQNVAKLELLRICKISFHEFLLLLSPQTKVLICNDVTYTSPPAAAITLKEIFEHVPNIKKFEFLRTNANLDFLWLKYLNERKNKASLKVFKISISSLQFSAMDLAIYMTEPSVKNTVISLYLDGFKNISTEKLHYDVIDYLRGYFVEKSNLVAIDGEPCLFIAQQLIEMQTVPFGYFTLV